MIVTSRSALQLRAAQRALGRHIHTKTISGGMQSIVRKGHVNDASHLPFSYARKPAFLGKMAVFCTTAFAVIPFGAVL
ncbi:hypothetical protein BDP27DRAFT_619698 [Rhodocollybia butyracea]|uniref:Cytochrome c oxidase subunit 8, mitochondrial n=1 Tax=Rhodocollybia butyracea TaxID=206335 RepID=A0A9P5PVT4_9AGAR|nr:hypothetical protein BDP27DRAFT_619698 [Rhodocollybia butyracea]